MSPALRRAPRRGSVTGWVLVCLAVLLGILAIAMDGGRMMDERQHAQATADAAALAAAADLYEHYALNEGADPDGTAADAARRLAAANGYANNGTDTVVTVHIPPRSGPFAGKADHVEVVVQSNLPPGFSALFADGSLPVKARAVARGRPKQFGLLLLKPTGTGLTTGGLAGLEVKGTVTINSTGLLSFVNLSIGTVVADAFDLVGGLSDPKGTLLGRIATGQEPTPDPLRTIPPPNPADYPVQSSSCYKVNGPDTLQPGVYRGGIDVSATGQATLRPGIYILDGGGLRVTGSGSITGTEVMIYNTGGGKIELLGNGGINLTAPLSGIYAGITLFQDRSLTEDVTMRGNSNLQIGGTIYAPAAHVDITGTVDLKVGFPGGSVIARTMSVGGSARFVIDPGKNRPKVPDVRLVD